MRSPTAIMGLVLFSSCSGGRTAVCPTVPSSSASPAPPSTAPTGASSSPMLPSSTEVARSIVEALARGDFANVVGRFDVSMREKISVQKLRDTWLDATRGAGNFKSLRPEAPRSRDGWPIDEFIAEFAQRDVEIKVTVRPETGEVAGLWIWRRRASDDVRDRTVPEGWSLSGGGAAEYRFALDSDVKHGGKASVRVSPVMDGSSRYGTLMQGFDATPYRRKRIRLAAFVRGQGLTGRADAWARAQGPSAPADSPGLGGGVCALSGTFDWKPCEIVFEVPAEAAEVQIGFGLAGSGTLWIDDVKVEIVPKKTAPTNAHRLSAPTNLDFETSRSDGGARSADELTGPPAQ